MFNPFKITVRKDTRKMGFFSKLKLGALATNAASVARDIVANIGVDGIIQIIGKIVDIESRNPHWRELARETGSQTSLLKASALADWFADRFPEYAGAVGIVRAFASAFVALANALGWFKK